MLKLSLPQMQWTKHGSTAYINMLRSGWTVKKIEYRGDQAYVLLVLVTEDK